VGLEGRDGKKKVDKANKKRKGKNKTTKRWGSEWIRGGGAPGSTRGKNSVYAIV